MTAPLISDPVLIFAVLGGVLLVAPLLARVSRLPEIIILILAGVALGPNSFGIVGNSEQLTTLGNAGLLFIVFLAGLEINLLLFRKDRRRSLIFGLTTYAIPQVLGGIGAFLLLGFSWQASIILGSMLGSHTLLAYPIAKRLRVHQNRAVSTTVGGSIISDTLALTVLALVAASVAGDLTTGFIFQLAGAIASFLLLVGFVLPWIGKLYFRHLMDGGSRDFIFVLTMGFVAAYLAQYVGLVPIIGAFLAGVSLNPLIPDSSTLMNRLHFLGHTILIPIFLFTVGFLVDVGALFSSPEVISVMVFMTVTLVATKWLAADVVCRFFKFNDVENRLMFGLSVPQAAGTLAAVMVGYELGIFGTAVINSAVFMILVTCVVGPWVVESSGRKLAVLEESRIPALNTLPPRILVPLANPTSATELMEVAFMLHGESSEPIVPVTIADEHLDPEAQVAASEHLLGHAVAHAASAGIPVVPITRLAFSIEDGLSRAITELRATTVVIGWSGDAPQRQHAIGSVLDHIIERHRAGFVICKFSGAINTASKIYLVVPPLIDRDPEFSTVCGFVKTIAIKLSAKLVLVCTTSESSRVKDTVSRVRPKMECESLEILHWHHMTAEMQAAVTPDDLLIIISTRTERLGWSYSLAQLPRRMVDAFPKNNLIVMIPPESEEDEERRVV